MEMKYVILVLVLLLVLVAVSVLGLRKSRRSKGNAVLVANTHTLTKLPTYVKKYRRYVISVIASSVILGLMLVSLSVMAGRPVKSTTVSPEQYNRDIMLCLDVSSSMFPFDEAVTDTYLELIDGFKGERVSMVVWNSTAYQEFPFTDDYAFLKEQLTEMKKAFAEAEGKPEEASLRFYGTVNTAIASSSLAGDGLAACAMKFDKLESKEKRHRSIVLSTDNAVLGTETIVLREAVDMLKARDIQLYSIDPYGDSVSQSVHSEKLKEQTERIGGTYFSLSNGKAPTEIIEKVNQTQINSFKGEKKKVIFDEPDLFMYPLVFLFLGYIFFMSRGRL